VKVCLFFCAAKSVNNKAEIAGSIILLPLLFGQKWSKTHRRICFGQNVLASGKPSIVLQAQQMLYFSEAIVFLCYSCTTPIAEERKAVSSQQIAFSIIHRFNLS
jgi:hypothetical protein